MTQAVKRKVSDIVKTDLDGRFRQHLVFDPIMVEQEVDEFDDEAPYIRIRIIFDGDQKHLDPRWTVGLITRIRPKLLEIGVEEFPLPSFIANSVVMAAAAAALGVVLSLFLSAPIAEGIRDA